MDSDRDLQAYFDWITSDLAVGDFNAATPPFCWEYFDVILNLSEAEHPETQGGNAYLWLPFTDGDPEGFAKNLPDALDFLEAHKGKARLVHCAAGVSRSVSTVLAYLCDQREIQATDDIAQVYEFIESSRDQVYPCQEFVDTVAKRYDVPAPLIGW